MTDNLKQGLAVPNLRATNVEASDNGDAGIVTLKTSRISGLTALSNGGPTMAIPIPTP